MYILYGRYTSESTFNSLSYALQLGHCQTLDNLVYKASDPKTGRHFRVTQLRVVRSIVPNHTERLRLTSN